MVLRWFKEATDVRALARGAAVSIATACRYLHQAIGVIAAQAAELPEVLAEVLAGAFDRDGPSGAWTAP
jgi:Na+/alanine symporter